MSTFEVHKDVVCPECGSGWFSCEPSEDFPETELFCTCEDCDFTFFTERLDGGAV